MTDADKKLYDKAEELFCQNCKLRTEQCLFAYRKVNGIEDCHKSCGCNEVPAWIDGYKEGLKAKINATTISDCSFKDEWHYLAKGELPKEDRYYLVYTDRGNYYVSKHHCNTNYWIGIQNQYVSIKNIVAWRELPEPPKEEE